MRFILFEKVLSINKKILQQYVCSSKTSLLYNITLKIEQVEKLKVQKYFAATQKSGKPKKSKNKQ